MADSRARKRARSLLRTWPLRTKWGLKSQEDAVTQVKARIEGHHRRKKAAENTQPADFMSTEVAKAAISGVVVCDEPYLDGEYLCTLEHGHTGGHSCRLDARTVVHWDEITWNMTTGETK